MIQSLKFLFLFLPVVSLAQELPDPVTNQAVVGLVKDGKPVIYSFYGLDSTKKQPGVHRKVYRLDLTTKKSIQVGEVPENSGRLASAASVINHKVYLVGGYSVAPSGKEKSSPYLFVFDPSTENFTREPNLAVPVDDQMQSVWRDSLLFVISGWYDSLTIRTVQLYNPSTNQWTLSTPLPDDNQSSVFGGCALIAGDTIYALGGAMFGTFYPPSRNFYKGHINPKNPAEIKWSKSGEYPGPFRYRCAAYKKGNEIIFVGGSNETYNYNAISYAEKKPVSPNASDLVYHIKTGKFTQRPSPFPIMDLRNIAQTGKDQFWIVGGMEPNQKVSRKIRKLN